MCEESYQIIYNKTFCKTFYESETNFTKHIIPCNKNGFCITIDNFLSDEKCEEFINNYNYKDLLTISKINGTILDTEYRNSTSGKFENKDFTDYVYDKIKLYLPQKIDNYEIHSINPRFTFMKYIFGQYFKSHCDGNQTFNGVTSFITLQIYCNTVPCENGGGTQFNTNNSEYSNLIIQPVKGKLLAFEQDFSEHQGCQQLLNLYTNLTILIKK